MRITNEVVSGANNNWTLARTPVPNSVTIYGSGIRLTPGTGQDYSITGVSVTTVNPYTAGQVLADYDVLGSTNIVSGITDQLSPFALTTLQRVKDLLFDPNLTISLTGASLAASSTNVTGITVPNGKSLKVGQIIMGTGIPSGTLIAAILSPTQITLSQASTQDNTGQTLIVVDQPTAYDGVLVRLINWATNYIDNECGRPSGFVQQSYVNDTYFTDSPGERTLLLRNTPVFSISSFQWRAGTPSNPSWTDFLADEYELVNPRTDPISGTVWYPSGEVRLYGGLPRIVRASYVAGYPVDWGNPENHSTHWLPGDLTNLCENLVVRRYTRRSKGGKSSISVEGSTSSFRNELDAEDLDVIGQYRQITF